MAPPSAGTPCPLCRGRDPAPHLALEPGIRIGRCRTCGLLYRLDPPEDPAALHDEGYFRNLRGTENWGGSGDYVADRDRLIRGFGEHLAELERLHPPGRLLDVGCALGYLLEAARRRGWEVAGIDVSRFAVERAKREFGLDVRLGTVFDADFPPGRFDIVTAFEFIEHVPDPVGALQRMRPWLTPGGLLLLTTPNAGSLAARWHPREFPGFTERPHLSYFDRKTMRLLLERAGFVPVELRTDLALVTTDTLASAGVRDPSRWRSLADRIAPRLKARLRRAAGVLLGGSSMRVVARPDGTPTRRDGG